MKVIATTTSKGIFGSLWSMTLIYLADMEILTIAKSIGIVFTALIAVGTFVSICFDIRRKWRARNKIGD